MGGDPYDLNRFVEAQDHGSTYERALAEIRRGRKTSHWMWFVFPQIAGLGFSAMSQRYAIADRSEAQAYLAHGVLGARLRECAGSVAQLDASPVHVFGGIDAQKLHSSMTLFDLVEPQVVFRTVLDKHFGGVADDATEQRIGR
ncbi:DUF1810 domain-containing protein [uncultured Jatrophihabitans sp.]|uniref:DUF1810 domain-containing protein n=1 Tax=uncultured Jatrophihabitans sp. TaxID=1610747 RepID=UPI0035CAE6EA